VLARIPVNQLFARLPITKYPKGSGSCSYIRSSRLLANNRRPPDNNRFLSHAFLCNPTQRKHTLARQPCLDLPGISKHVVQQGNDRQACFAAATDYLRYLKN
jgi:hypothetical protein